jgi:hypothetical protein
MIDVDGRAATASLRQLRSALIRAALDTQLVTLAETEKHAKSTTLWKDRTGWTRAHISSGTASLSSGWVVAAGFASRFLENGTPPHDIVAKNGGTLRFEIAGTVFFRRMVHHPGTAERPFMQQARDHGQQVADYAAEHFAERAIQAHR